MSEFKENGTAETSRKSKIRFSRKVSKSPVYLTDFSHGRLRANHHGSVKFHCYHKTNSNEEKRILVADNGRVQYSGASFGMDAEERNRSLRYMVGVRSKRTGKMKLYQSLFFHLKPIISEPLKKADDSKSLNRSYREIRDELTLNFGSKLGIKAMTSRMKYATVVDDTATPTAHELDDLKLEDEEVKPSPKIALRSTVTTAAIPPRNINAPVSSEVYSINDIITEEEFVALESKAESLKATTDAEIVKWKSDKFYCNYVMSHLESEEIDSKTAKMLVYYNYLISVSKLTYREIRLKDPIPNIPEPYKQNILQRYTMSTTTEHGRLVRSFPIQMKDKLLSYTLVLALFIDDFSVNLDLVQSDIKTAIVKLSKVSQVLGCHVTNRKVEDSMVKFADLKIPLHIPTEKRYMRKPIYGK